MQPTMKIVESNNLQLHKIYYSFVFDPNYEYQLQFRVQREMRAVLIKTLLMLEHGIDQAAMCHLELYNQQGQLIMDHVPIKIGEKIKVKRVPIQKYANIIRHIIKCFENKDHVDSMQLGQIDLGINYEELNDILHDNFQATNLNSFIDELKQRFMIQDDIPAVAETNTQIMADMPTKTRGGRHLKNKERQHLAYLNQNETSESSDSAMGGQYDDQGIGKKTVSQADKIFDVWMSAGSLFKKSRKRKHDQ